jgi:hypothetical protein
VAVQTAQITADHESWQPAGDEQQWSDSFYFAGGNGRGLAFYARIGRRPNESRDESRTEGALGIWLAGEGFLLSFAREAASAREISCGPVAFHPLAPLALWELRLDGRGRLFERAEHVATARDRFREVEVGGAVRFAAWGQPLSFRSGLSSAVASSHYEQPGSVAGVIVVDGRRLPLTGHGLRDHSWGVRDWQRVPYWRWFGMLADPDNYVLLNNVGLEGGGETAGGFLMRDGRLANVEHCETDSELDPELGCQRRFEARARDALGRTTTLEGTAIEVAPLRQRRDGLLTHVNEALTEYRWEGRSGTGISEYLVQAEERLEEQPKEGSKAGNGAGR